jgi:hypothetical protein
VYVVTPALGSTDAEADVLGARLSSTDADAPADALGSAGVGVPLGSAPHAARARAAVRSAAADRAVMGSIGSGGS